jgi:RNA polymerase sigma factor (sigma-70 family)
VTFDRQTDEQLLAAIPSSVEALEVFYRRHVQGVIRFFAGRCRTPDDVGDRVATTFLAVVESCESFDPARGNAVGWLYGIARNTYRTDASKRERGNRLTLRIHGRPLVSPDDAERIAEMIDAERQVARMQPTLDSLRPSERALLDRIVYGDERPAVAARALGISPAAGRARLARLRQTVRIQAQLAGEAAERKDES